MQGVPRPTAFWKAWDSPVIAIGGGSFLSELVEIAGGRNIYGDDPRPAFDVTIEDVVRRDPDVVLRRARSPAQRMQAAPAWRALRAVREGPHPRRRHDARRAARACGSARRPCRSRGCCIRGRFRDRTSAAAALCGSCSRARCSSPRSPDSASGRCA